MTGARGIIWEKEQGREGFSEEVSSEHRHLGGEKDRHANI